jgi:hypothetical protein
MSKTYRDSRWDTTGIVSNLLKDTEIPRMVKIRQRFESDRIEDVTRCVYDQLEKDEIRSRIKPGMKIAITAGSRGISHYQEIMRALVTKLKEFEAQPFLFPAMGSHGGGTAEGQRAMLESLGITEESVGAPIYSSMEVVQIGINEDGRPVYLDRFASEADGIVVFNRVKPHTNFRGKYESGLLKMLTIGAGKNIGAALCHRMPMDDMPHNIYAFGTAVIKNANILFGLATVENAYDEVKKITAIPAERIAEVEAELQIEAKASMPRIFFDEFDVLVVNQIGKNFSGPGMDPNITGISGNPHMKLKPVVQRRVVLDLSDETHGNATGLGLADFSTKRAFDKIDFDAGYPNTITSRTTAGGKIPPIMKNDVLAIAAGIYTCDTAPGQPIKIVRIPNTLHIDEIEISEALLVEAKSNPNIEIISEPFTLAFDKAGNLCDMEQN